MSSYRRRSNPAAAVTEAKQYGVHYLRVSSVRQTHTAADAGGDGNSIETQREECDAKARTMNVPVQQVFVEPGKSAQTIDKRPEFRRLMAYLAEHPEVSYVFVYSRSRAFRNIEDAILTRKHLRGLGVKIISTKEDFGDSLEAEFMETISDSMNDLQNKKNGQDIKIKMAHKARNGGTIGRAPIGYLNTRVDHEGRMINTVVQDEVRAPLVRVLFELYATGEYNAEALAEVAEEIGLRARPAGRWKAERPLSLNSIYRMLADPYYAGYTCYNGELFAGRHKAIVDQNLFDRVQDVLQARSSNGSRDYILQHYLKGTLFCDRCRRNGRTRRLIYTEANGSGGTYAYYFCRGRQQGLCDLRYLPIEVVEEAVAEHYATESLSHLEALDLKRNLGDAIADEQALTRDLKTQLRSELASMDEQEDRLLDALTDGSLPQGKIRKRLNDLTRRRDAISARLRELQQDLDGVARTFQRLIEIGDGIHGLYLRADDDARQRINNALFEALYINDHGDVADDVPSVPLRTLREARLLAQAPAPLRTRQFNRDPHAELLLERETPAHGLGGGSSNYHLVELRGFEPLTFSLRTRRATNCATAPSEGKR